MTNTGVRIRGLRLARGMTQVEFAKALGINQSTLSAIENGAGFGADILMAMSDELGVSPEQIMRGGDPLTWPLPKVSIARYLALSEEDKGYAQARFAQAIEECEQTSQAGQKTQKVHRKTPHTIDTAVPRLSASGHEKMAEPMTEDSLFSVRTGADNESRSIRRVPRQRGGRSV